MALSEQTLIDQIEVTRNGTIQVREANLVLRDGTEIAKTFHRYCLHPGADLTGQPAQVAAIANAAWTPKVVAAWVASQES
jgi:hypothetical protein